METRTLEDYCDFAFTIQFLRRPHQSMPEYVINALDSVIHSLSEHGLSHAADQAFPLKALKGRLESDLNVNRTEFRGGLPDKWINELANLMEPVVRNVRSEGRNIHLARLDPTAASARLRKFGVGSLTTEQEALKSEVIQCLEIGAFRAAMVMGWNLSYDIVRRWIFDTKLCEFNLVLISKERKKGVPWTAISEYEDFFPLQERDVLNWAMLAGLFNEKVHRALVERLDRRNDYAHANFKRPDATQVTAYVNELMTLLEDSPFTFGK